MTPRQRRASRHGTWVHRWRKCKLVLANSQRGYANAGYALHSHAIAVGSVCITAVERRVAVHLQSCIVAVSQDARSGVIAAMQSSCRRCGDQNTTRLYGLDLMPNAVPARSRPSNMLDGMGERKTPVLQQVRCAVGCLPCVLTAVMSGRHSSAVRRSSFVFVRPK